MGSGATSTRLQHPHRTHKRRADGTLERYKARWVIKGFTQRPGVHYDETFSPVVKPSTVRMVLSLALTHFWLVHQLDLKNAFLHGLITETVYSSQPAGFVDSSRPNMVCRLNKSLYDLKQAHTGFSWRPSQIRPCLSITMELRLCTCCSMLMILSSQPSSESLLRRIITSLQQEFAIKDLGVLQHFLGVTVEPHLAGLLLHQRQYTSSSGLG